MSSSQGELRFPLEERFLARARVNDNRFDEWRAIAQKEIDAVLSNPRSWYYRPNDLKQAYRPVYEQDAIRGFVKASTVADNSEKRELLGLAHLETTLDELTTGYLATTTPDQRAVFAQIYGEWFLDAAILRVAEGPRADDPFHFVGLKWLAFGSPAPAIMMHRDYVFFEYSGTTFDISNRKVLFVYQKSFPLQSGELSEPDKGCARTEHYQLSFYRMEGGGVLLQGVSSYEPQADAPSWVASRVITETFDAIKNLVGLTDARAVVAAGLLKGAKGKASSENKTCVVCQKKFGMMRSRHGCRSCSQSMCKHCVTKLSLFNDEALYTNAPAVVCENFCLNCLKHARSQRQLEALSATLTKTTIGELKSDAISTSSSHAATVSSPYDGASKQPHHHHHHAHRDGLRSSIERQIGLSHHSDSGSDAGGSNRSMPSHSLYGALPVDSPASASYASSSSASRVVHNTPQQNLMFEQMNASIRQQEELLLVIQQERAKLQSRQQHVIAPPFATPYNAPAPAPEVAVAYATPVDDADGEERFEVLS